MLLEPCNTLFYVFADFAGLLESLFYQFENFLDKFIVETTYVEQKRQRSNDRLRIVEFNQLGYPLDDICLVLDYFFRFGQCPFRPGTLCVCLCCIVQNFQNSLPACFRSDAVPFLDSPFWLFGMLLFEIDQQLRECLWLASLRRRYWWKVNLRQGRGRSRIRFQFVCVASSGRDQWGAVPISELYTGQSDARLLPVCGFVRRIIFPGDGIIRRWLIH